MTYFLVLVMLHGSVVLGGEMSLEQCVANAQRITVRHNEQLQRKEPRTYPGLIRAHCERIDP